MRTLIVLMFISLNAMASEQQTQPFCSAIQADQIADIACKDLDDTDCRAIVIGKVELGSDGEATPAEFKSQLHFQDLGIKASKAFHCKLDL